MSNVDNSIDAKPPKLRGYSARGRRKALEAPISGIVSADVHHDDVDDTETADLNIRVKDRAGDSDPTTKKGRIGNLFKEAPTSGIKGLLNKDGVAGAATDLKESIKRPLTGLFRRPGSRSGSRPPEAPQAQTMDKRDSTTGIVTAVDDRSLSPDMARRVSAASMARNSRNIAGMGQSDWESVANAPHLTVNQLHGMLQIDAFATKYPHLAKLDDIDISLLSKYLCHEDEVKDEDVPWTWDYVFASVSTEMREEWALDEEGDQDEQYPRR